MALTTMLRAPLVLAVLLLGLVACGDDDPTLRISALNPDTGDSKGGTYVRITGNRFLKDGPRNAEVYFGSRRAQIIRWQSDSELIVQAPGGKADETVDVLVIFDPGGRLTIKKGFKFVDKDDQMPSIENIDVGSKDKQKK